MQRLFLCLVAVLWCAYASNYEESLAESLIEVHSSTRNSFKYQGKKLPPLKYSKNLVNLAREWAVTCSENRPTDPRFANLGSNVFTVRVHWPLKQQWKYRLSVEAKAYNPATGQCIGYSCEHYRQVVQSNITEFGCAVKRCSFAPPKPALAHLSVCLYYAEQQSTPVHSTSTSSTTTRRLTTTTTTTTTMAPTTTTTTTKRPSTTTITTTRTPTTSATTTNAPTTATTTPKTSTISMLPSADNSTMKEVIEDKEDVEEEEKEEDKTAGTSELAKLSPHLLSLMLTAIILLS